MAVEIDPVEGPEIMNLLSIPTHSLEDPRSFNRIREVVEYFQGKPDRIQSILKIISARPGDDKLDVVWTYIQLRKEMAKKIQELNPQDFTENIQEEIKQEYITKGSIDTVKSQLNERIAQEEKSMRDRVDTRKEQTVRDKKEGEAVEEASALAGLQETKTRLEEIESIKQELEVYG